MKEIGFNYLNILSNFSSLTEEELEFIIKIQTDESLAFAEVFRDCEQFVFHEFESFLRNMTLEEQEIEYGLQNLISSFF